MTCPLRHFDASLMPKPFVEFNPHFVRGTDSSPVGTRTRGAKKLTHQRILSLCTSGSEVLILRNPRLSQLGSRYTPLTRTPWWTFFFPPLVYIHIHVCVCVHTHTHTVTHTHCTGLWRGRVCGAYSCIRRARRTCLQLQLLRSVAAVAWYSKRALLMQSKYVLHATANSSRRMPIKLVA